MNKIGENQCKDILSSFAWDSTGYEDCPGIRAREREDSHVFYFRDWFNIVTDRGLREWYHFKPHFNSFSEKRDKFDEDGEVSLCAKVRNMFDDDRSSESSQKERLIAKQVKKYTNLGEEYNQTSLYDTIQECLDNGEDLLIEPTKQAQANIVMSYLKYLELEQYITNLHKQGLELSKEETELESEINSIKKQLTLLRKKQRAKQQERSNLQQKQYALQQEQDALLR